VPDISQETLVALFEAMTPERIAQLATAVASQDRAQFRCDATECVALVERLAGHPSTPTILEAAA
jgi:hypothetical protein